MATLLEHARRDIFGADRPLAIDRKQQRRLFTFDIDVFLPRIPAYICASRLSAFADTRDRIKVPLDDWGRGERTMRGIKHIVAILTCASAGGCTVDDSFLALSEPTPMPVAALAVAPQASPIPWQLTPASTASIAQGESTIIVADPKYGKIKGTPVAIANLDKPVFAFAKRGRIVDACREAIAPQAKGIGAYSVQAAAAGPVKAASGDRVQQVFFRIIYDRTEYLEVRQSALLCKVDPSGRVLEAKPV